MGDQDVLQLQDRDLSHGFPGFHCKSGGSADSLTLAHANWDNPGGSDSLVGRGKAFAGHGRFVRLDLLRKPDRIVRVRRAHDSSSEGKRSHRVDSIPSTQGKLRINERGENRTVTSDTAQPRPFLCDSRVLNRRQFVGLHSEGDVRPLTHFASD